jgi:uncharacterized protein
MNSTQAQAPWYRHRWPWLLMIGPVAVLIAGTITTWISFSGADALVVDDYYKQGKAINQDLRRDEAAARLGLTASLRYDAVTDSVSGRLEGNDKPAALIVQLLHPTVPEKDVRTLVKVDGDGSFAFHLPLLDRAYWKVQLEDQDRQWRLQGSWRWPEQKQTDIRPFE